MKILLLSSDSPLPITDGIRLRTYHLFSRLAEKHEITLLSFFRSADDLDGLRQLADRFASVRVVHGVNHSSFLDYVRSSVSAAPFFVERIKSNEMQMALSQELDAHNYDLLFVNDLRMAHYAIKGGSIPKVIDACDALSLLFRRAFGTASIPHQKVRFLQLWLKTRLYEKKMYKHFDLCTVISPVDARALMKQNQHLNLVVVPNGVDTDYFHPSPDTREQSGTVVFVGVMNYPPNIDAVRYFASEVLPLVQRHVPSVRFLIVGRNGSIQTLGLQDNANVEVVGTVQDIRPFVWRSEIFVCPMRFGSGVKNKVLEAMAMSKPVVGTSLAYEGLDVVSNEHVVSGEDVESLAASTVLLLSKTNNRLELGRKARELVKERYSWQAAVNKLDVLLENVVDKRARRDFGAPVFALSLAENDSVRQPYA